MLSISPFPDPDVTAIIAHIDAKQAAYFLLHGGYASEKFSHDKPPKGDTLTARSKLWTKIDSPPSPSMVSAKTSEVVHVKNNAVVKRGYVIELLYIDKEKEKSPVVRVIHRIAKWDRIPADTGWQKPDAKGQLPTPDDDVVGPSR